MVKAGRCLIFFDIFWYVLIVNFPFFQLWKNRRYLNNALPVLAQCLEELQSWRRICASLFHFKVLLFLPLQLLLIPVAHEPRWNTRNRMKLSISLASSVRSQLHTILWLASTQFPSCIFAYSPTLQKITIKIIQCHPQTVEYVKVLLSGCSVENAILSSTVQSRKSNKKDSGSNWVSFLNLRSTTSALVDQQVPIPAMATHESLSSNINEFHSTWRHFSPCPPFPLRWLTQCPRVNKSKSNPNVLRINQGPSISAIESAQQILNWFQHECIHILHNVHKNYFVKKPVGQKPLYTTYQDF